MIRTYRYATLGISLEDQTEVCSRKGMDANAVYTDKKATFPQDRERMIDSLRLNGKGDIILVSDLAVLAANRKDLRAVRAALKAKGASIFEGRTGRRSTNAEQYAEMIQDALDRWSHKGRRWTNAKLAAEDASKGGKALAKSRAERRAPKGLAIKIWRDGTLDTDEAVDKINRIPGYYLDWTRTSCYRHLGMRKLPTGPRGPQS